MNCFTIHDITVYAEKRHVKNYRITVTKEGRVEMIAPYFVSQKEILNLLEQKYKWIKKHLYSKQTERKPIANNSEIIFCGEVFGLKIIVSDKNKVEIVEKDIIVYCKNSDKNYIKPLLYNFFKIELNKILPKLIDSEQQSTGLKCSAYSIRKMKSRFGSCNTKTKCLTFAVCLAQSPLPCIEYVVLHELAHTVVPNHGAEFKRLLEKYMPDYKDRKKLLNSIQYI